MIVSLWCVLVVALFGAAFATHTPADEKEEQRRRLQDARLDSTSFYPPAKDVSCDLDAALILHLAERLPKSKTFPAEIRRMQGSYGYHWKGDHTCWLANQILCTEVSGLNSQCRTRQDNRKLLDALLVRAGSLRPMAEAIHLVGALLYGLPSGKENLPATVLARGFQIDADEASVSPDTLRTKKLRILRKLRGDGGAAFLPKPMDSEWLKEMKETLKSRELMTFPKLLRNPSVERLAYDPFILDIIHNVMGIPPILHSVDILGVSTGGDKIPPKPEPYWYKDFDTPHMVRVYVYLADVLQKDSAYSPHRYLPHTQDVVGPSYDAVDGAPFSQILRQAGGGRQEAEEYAAALKAGRVPRAYLLRHVFTENMTPVYGKAGTAWIEDGNVFRERHDDLGSKAPLLLRIQYTATGYCASDGGGEGTSGTAYSVLQDFLPALLPDDEITTTTRNEFPRLFQWASAPKVTEEDATMIATCSRSLKDKEFQSRATKEARISVEEDDLETNMNGYINTDYPMLPIPCWEVECERCLRDKVRGGSCETCSRRLPCHCSCDFGMSCQPSDRREDEVPSVIHPYVEIPPQENVSMSVIVDDLPAGALIPPIIHHVWVSEEPLPTPTHKEHSYTMQQSWAQVPGYQHERYSHIRAREFIVEHFTQDVVEAYDLLSEGKWKSDLARLCILLVKGGVYVDNDILLTGDLEAMLQRDNTGFLATLSLDDGGTKLSSTSAGCILNAVIGVYPGHPFIATVLADVVSSIYNRVKFPDLVREMCSTDVKGNVDHPPVWRIVPHPEVLLTGQCRMGTSINVALGRRKTAMFETGTNPTDSSKIPVLGRFRLLSSMLPREPMNPRLGDGPKLRRFSFLDPDSDLKEMCQTGVSNEKATRYVAQLRQTGSGPWHVTEAQFYNRSEAVSDWHHSHEWRHESVKGRNRRYSIEVTTARLQSQGKILYSTDGRVGEVVNLQIPESTVTYDFLDSVSNSLTDTLRRARGGLPSDPGLKMTRWILVASVVNFLFAVAFAHQLGLLKGFKLCPRNGRSKRR